MARSKAPKAGELIVMPSRVKKNTTPKTSQRGFIPVDFSTLEQLLPLPNGMKIVAVEIDYLSQRLRLIVLSPDLAEVDESMVTPEVNIAISDIIDEHAGMVRRTATIG